MAIIGLVRWPSIKIILVSGQVTPTKGERPTESRFFGKPLEAAQMIIELQDMMTMGQDSLKIISAEIGIDHLGVGGVADPKAAAEAATSQKILTAENDSLCLLLEQAGIDAKALLAQAGY